MKANPFPEPGSFGQSHRRSLEIRQFSGDTVRQQEPSGQ
jgi:hypothetical protein